MNALPVSSSGWGRWRRLVDEARADPGIWKHADTKDAEHKARNLQTHLRNYYGARVSYRRLDDDAWGVWVMWPEDET